MTFFIVLIKTLLATPGLGALVHSFIVRLISWYLTSRDEEHAEEIAEAAKVTKRAQTKEERIEAAKLWQSVLSRHRFK